jgi:hypothetical protein
MKTTIHYEVIAKLHRSKAIDYSRLIEFSKSFVYDSPIIAREKAFRFYQNYIDVLVDATGHTYRSDRQARELLTSFIDPKATVSNVQGSNNPFSSLDYGIGIFLVIDYSIHDYIKVGDKYMIHGIGNLIDGTASAESLILCLEIEYDYYMQLGYPTNHSDTIIEFCNFNEWEEGYRDEEPSTYTILKTPFDWTGMDKPYWWIENILNVN